MVAITALWSYYSPLLYIAQDERVPIHAGYAMLVGNENVKEKRTKTHVSYYSPLLTIHRSRQNAGYAVLMGKLEPVDAAGCMT